MPAAATSSTDSSSPCSYPLPPPPQAKTMPLKKASPTMKKPHIVAPKKKPPKTFDTDQATELARCAIIIVDRQKQCKIQWQADVELAKGVSFAGYAGSQGNSGGKGFLGSVGFLDDSAPAVMACS
jgi:hypothetical protein